MGVALEFAIGFALRPPLTLLTLYCKWAGAELEQAHALDGVVRGHVERGKLLHLGGGHRPRCPHRFHILPHVGGIHRRRREREAELHNPAQAELRWSGIVPTRNRRHNSAPEERGVLITAIPVQPRFISNTQPKQQKKQ